MSAGGKVRISFAAAPSVEQHITRLFGEVGEAFGGVRIVYDTSRWKIEHEIATVGPVSISARPAPSALRRERALSGQMGKSFNVFAPSNDYVASVAAVASVRPAFRNVLLTAETHRARSAVARLECQRNLVNEGSHSVPLRNSPYEAAFAL